MESPNRDRVEARMAYEIIDTVDWTKEFVLAGATVGMVVHLGASVLGIFLGLVRGWLKPPPAR